MSNVELCFCIPTFNREKSVFRLVKDILSCNDLDINVVILDNGSTDNTLSVLKEIKDSRLFVYSNGENKGALYNMVNVLNKGIGNFLVYSTDQDYVNINEIKNFKKFLSENNEISCGYCKLNSKSDIDYEIFQIGYESIKNIAYKGFHPTGHFFKNSLLKTVNITERFSDYNFVDLFPLEFVFAELCTLGGGAIYHRKIFTPETGKNVVNHKSSTTNGKSKNAFFSPDARLKLAVNFTKHIESLPIKRNEKKLLINDIFIDNLFSATKGYRSILKNEKLCIHYCMETRDVKFKEIINIAINFYKNYVVSTEKIIGSTLFSKTVFITRIMYKISSNYILRKKTD